MYHFLVASGVVVALVVSTLPNQSAAELHSPTINPASLPVAPPPRLVEGTRVHRDWCDQSAEEPDTATTHDSNGVIWKVNIKLRQLPSKNELIDFCWSIGYTGPRSPLIILRPSLSERYLTSTTIVELYAFPKYTKQGRVIQFTAPYPPGGRDALIHIHPPRASFLSLRRKQSVTGIDSIPVKELKKELLTRYPEVFSSTVPPTLFAGVQHDTEERGIILALDAWTGQLNSPLMRVPPLSSW